MNLAPNGWQSKFKQKGENKQIIIGEIKMFNFKNNNGGNSSWL
jgi:hypothetical protein